MDGKPADAERQQESFTPEPSSMVSAPPDEGDSLDGVAGEGHVAHAKSSSAALALGALGVVFGDIGTSPLYSLRECFHGSHDLPLTPSNVFGVLSLIAWSLIIVVTVKYLVFVMRADNRGEGGILALMALAQSRGLPKPENRLHRMSLVLVLGLFGSALLYGDGIITPAVSVLSAVEGLEVALPYFKSYIVPITVAILLVFFLIQRRGTERIGRLFGPVMLVWFATLIIMGIPSIARHPAVLGAINPMYAFRFLLEHQGKGFAVMGSVFLVVTGGEALYADMGHFGRLPIRLGWFFVAFPALVIHYFGQGALLIMHPEFVENPFYHLAPDWALYPLVILSTTATVIASQAMLTGAFSLSHQAVQLGYLPRMNVKYTSAAEKGQIYVPAINWMMLVGTLGLVIAFQSSSALAAAYGIAVTMTMVITTLLTYVVARHIWHWSVVKTLLIISLLLSVDLVFFGANALKVESGGWLPLALGCIVYFLMMTWRKGRSIVAERLEGRLPGLMQFFTQVFEDPVNEVYGEGTCVWRVPGKAIFLASSAGVTPASLLQNTTHNRIVHETVVLLTVVTADIPHVRKGNRLEIAPLGAGFFRVIVHFGFMDTPDVPEALFGNEPGDPDLRRLEAQGLQLTPENSTYFLGHETLLPSKLPGMWQWRERLFAFMARNSETASSYFHLPSNKVMEIGIVVDL